MQTCPQLRNLAVAAACAAAAGSASSNTMTGAWPPSSIDTFFTPSAQRCSSCLPTGTEPVKDTLRTMGEPIRWRAMRSESPVTRLTAPGGISASWQAWISAMQEPGASDAGLTITEQPAPSAAAILRAGSRAGKFHAENAAHTPTGW